MDLCESMAAIASDEALWICVSDVLLSGHPMAHVAARFLMFMCRSARCRASLLRCGAMHIISSALSEPASALTIIMCLSSLQMLCEDNSALPYAEAAEIEVPLMQLLLQPPEHLMSTDEQCDESHSARATPRYMILSSLLVLLTVKKCRSDSLVICCVVLPV